MIKNHENGTVKRCFCLIMCAFVVLTGISSIPPVGADIVQPDGLPYNVVSASELEDSYILGTEIPLPTKVVEIDGKQVTAETVVIYPDGNAYSKPSLVLDRLGRYTVEYYVVSEGKIIDTSMDEFDVIEEYYTISGSASSYAEYTEAEKLFYPELGSGLAVTLQDGASISFNQTIDISSFTADDPIIEFYVVPATVGEKDFERMIITVTDVHDPSNYLTFRLRGSSDSGEGVYWSYILAGAAGQPLSGLENNLLHQNNNYGAPVRVSMCGRPVQNNPEGTLFSLRLDTETKWVWANDAYLGNTRVIGLGDSTYFSEIWGGFTTGEVKISMYPDTFKGIEPAKFVITEIAGMDLSNTEIIDIEKPEIILDVPENVPYALEGAYYPLPKVSARDYYTGECKVVTKVYYNYDDPTGRIDISVSDNKFFAETAGIYTVMFTAKDAFGNDSERRMDIVCKENLPEVSIYATAAGRITSGFVGQDISVADYISTGGTGDLKVSVAATCGGKKYLVADGKFRPMEAGVYSVIYYAEDYIGQSGMYVYNVNVTAADMPVYYGEPILLEYYISGNEYVFPEFSAYNYYTNTEEKSEIRIKTGDGESVLLGKDRRAEISTEKAADILQITYSSGGSSVTFERTVVNPEAGGEFDLKKYFICDEGVSITEESIYYKFGADGSDKGFVFANPLLAEEFSVRFASVPSESAFSAINIIMTDSLNPSERVVIKIRNDSGSASAEVNGKTAALQSGFGVNSASNEFILNYYRNTVGISGITIDITETCYGEEFHGFGSGFVIFEMSFEGVSGSSSVRLRNLNGQPINSGVSADTVSPKIVVLGDEGGTFAPNTTVTLSAAASGDVLSANVDFTLSVYDENFNPVTAEDGTLLENADPSKEYKILLVGGDYTVSYSSDDHHAARSANYQYIISVAEVNYPVLTVKSDIKTTVEKGETVKIPDASAEDADGTALAVYRYLIDTHGKITELESSVNAFTASSEGIYRLIYFTVNPSGATATIEYTVNAVLEG